jgi:hypothetical protein
MEFQVVGGIGQALPGRFRMVPSETSRPGRFGVIAALLSGRFAAEIPIPRCYHEEKAT